MIEARISSDLDIGDLQAGQRPFRSS